MKRLFAIFISICLLSCGKDNDNTPVNNDPDLPAGTIQYKYNDSLQVIHNGDDLAPYHFGYAFTEVTKWPATSTYSTNYYIYCAGADDVYSKGVGITVFTDSLQPKTYISSSTGSGGVSLVVRFKEVVSTMKFPEDHCSITITSYHDNLISGTFEGQLSNLVKTGDYTPPAVAKITEGKFRDIPVKW